MKRSYAWFDVKYVTPAEISTSQDGHTLAIDDAVRSVPISPLIDTAGDVHAKEGKQSIQYNDSINDSSIGYLILISINT